MHHRRFGSYQVTRPLGAGGLGVTYLATRVAGGGQERAFVLNAFPTDWLGEEALGPILEELRWVVSLRHPNIQTFEEVGQEQHEHYIASEYLDCMSLQTLLGTGQRVPTDLVFLAVIQALQALEYAHCPTPESPATIHGDICPSSLLLCRSGFVKLADFGCATLREWLRPHYPVSFAQHWRFRAPEQREYGTTNVQTDLYALGVILYEALSGTTLTVTSRSAESPAHQSIVPLRDVFPEVSPELEGIVHRAIATEPSERYSSASAFLGALDAFISPVTERQLQRTLREVFWSGDGEPPSQTSWFERAHAVRSLVNCTLQRPLLYLLTQDSVFHDTLCQEIALSSEFGRKYEVITLTGKEQIDWAREAFLHGSFVPHTVVFGGLDVALSLPFLAELRQHAEINRILVLEYPNIELLQMAIELCGLSGCLQGPIDARALFDIVERCSSPYGMRQRLSQLQDALTTSQQAEIEHLEQLKSLRAACETSLLTIKDLRFKQQVVEEKNRLLQQIAHAALEPRSSPPSSSEVDTIFFQGQVEQVRLSDLCQLMRMLQKTVLISMTSTTEDGSVYFVDGSLVHAVCGVHVGRMAVSVLLRWEQGSFLVQELQHDVERTITLSTEQLLLDILREHDESGAKSLEFSFPSGDWF